MGARHDAGRMRTARLPPPMLIDDGIEALARTRTLSATAPTAALPILRETIRGERFPHFSCTAASGQRSRRRVQPVSSGVCTKARVPVAWCKALGDDRHFRRRPERARSLGHGARARAVHRGARPLGPLAGTATTAYSAAPGSGRYAALAGEVGPISTLLCPRMPGAAYMNDPRRQGFAGSPSYRGAGRSSPGLGGLAAGRGAVLRQVVPGGGVTWAPGGGSGRGCFTLRAPWSLSRA